VTDPGRKRWYADWRVWFCLVALALFGLLESIVGLPFRILDKIWHLVF
jgi:hypothetical protein